MVYFGRKYSEVIGTFVTISYFFTSALCMVLNSVPFPKQTFCKSEFWQDLLVSVSWPVVSVRFCCLTSDYCLHTIDSPPGILHKCSVFNLGTAKLLFGLLPIQIELLFILGRWLAIFSDLRRELSEIYYWLNNSRLIIHWKPSSDAYMPSR